jgi:hypothetical protein
MSRKVLSYCIPSCHKGPIYSDLQLLYSLHNAFHGHLHVRDALVWFNQFFLMRKALGKGQTDWKMNTGMFHQLIRVLVTRAGSH